MLSRPHKQTAQAEFFFQTELDASIGSEVKLCSVGPCFKISISGIKQMLPGMTLQNEKCNLQNTGHKLTGCASLSFAVYEILPAGKKNSATNAPPRACG